MLKTDDDYCVLFLEPNKGKEDSNDVLFQGTLGIELD